MDKHDLDLLGNAIDSLVEALEKFEQGDNGNPKAYKFAVLHMAHFVELIFKHHITQKHPLLIYARPFDEKLNTQKTIGLWEAINFINNEEAGAVSKDFRSDLDWLKNLRNQIEHHKFEMNVAEVRSTMGRLFRSMMLFIEDYTDLDLLEEIPKEVKATFKVLSDEYELKVRDAHMAADVVARSAKLNPFENRPNVRVDCDWCGHFTMVVNEKSLTGYKCTLCDNTTSDDVPAACDWCQERLTFGELYSDTIEDNGEPREVYRCYRCSGQYHADRYEDE
ncbi:hypothetical protein N7676_08375 [Stenotrophomonas sp. GD03993]|uniref:hypothetical protein n=1 Tax=unclassified Stenotrophomonas TaxID=196198 RepID=UPI0013134079|nr:MULTISPECIES: hypothetical protein [unclassified Stenotrophomonas]MBH1462837.1 hypothetical protein [Stenotrophomonas maltophilia]MDH0188209.1 hypothetical protein [Stenotrophomonas sp. GD04051]MDH0463820.1 hypothetical protein [Stenotrophomonas sp. GD03993]MDH0876657.1 hypothetical protein [Stenotrophomonas sp. GD03877]MDH2155597.1 hypothetical protein [Stenotrophomonas sp. GD03657]